MALIYIKRRKEPIEIDNDRARRIKAMRFGDLNGNGKLDEHELIDLGDEWAGELGQIAAVEIKKEAPPRPVYDPEAERRAEEAKLRAIPIDKRVDAIGFGFFKLTWWMRSGRSPEHKEPPAHVMDYARRYALDYLKKNPNEVGIPINVYEPLLEKHWGKKKSLADEKRIIHSEVENSD